MTSSGDVGDHSLPPPLGGVSFPSSPTGGAQRQTMQPRSASSAHSGVVMQRTPWDSGHLLATCGLVQPSPATARTTRIPRMDTFLPPPDPAPQKKMGADTTLHRYRWRGTGEPGTGKGREREGNGEVGLLRRPQASFENFPSVASHRGRMTTTVVSCRRPSSFLLPAMNQAPFILAGCQPARSLHHSSFPFPSRFPPR
jgi:hypothetical protein